MFLQGSSEKGLTSDSDSPVKEVVALVTARSRTAALASLALALLVAALPQASAQSPTLNLSPFQVAPGDLVTLSGNGWPAGGAIAVTLDGERVGTTPSLAAASASGALSGISFQIPAIPRGTYRVVVTSGASSAGADVFVRPVLSPQTLAASAGDTATILALGFRPTATIVPTWNGQPLATTPSPLVSDADGSASFAFVVPDGVIGSHQVLLADPEGGQANAIVTTGPVVRVLNETVSPGALLAFRGTGYHASSTLTASFLGADGAPALASTVPLVVSTNSAGSWSSFFARVPQLPMGTHTLRVADGSGASRDASVRVVPAVSLAPGAGLPGDTVRASSGGWPAGAEVTVAFDGAALATAPATLVAAPSGALPPFTFVVPAHVSRTIDVVATAAGGTSAKAPFTVRVGPSSPEPVPPETSRHLATPPSPNGTEGWYKTVPSVVLLGGRTDALSWRLDAGEFRRYEAPFEIPEGAHTLEYYATSATGDREATTHRVEFRVDATPPTIERVTVGTGAKPTLTVAGSDATSGLAGATFLVSQPGGVVDEIPAERSGDGFTLVYSAPRVGHYAVTAWLADRAGNVAERTGYAFDVTAADVGGGAPAAPTVGQPTTSGDGAAKKTPAPGLALALLTALGAALLATRRAR